MTLMRLDFYFNWFNIFLNPSLDYVDFATTLKSVGNDAYIACILFWMCIQRRGLNKTRCALHCHSLRSHESLCTKFLLCIKNCVYYYHSLRSHESLCTKFLLCIKNCMYYCHSLRSHESFCVEFLLCIINWAYYYWVAPPWEFIVHCCALEIIL